MSRYNYSIATRNVFLAILFSPLDTFDNINVSYSSNSFCKENAKDCYFFRDLLLRGLGIWSPNLLRVFSCDICPLMFSPVTSFLVLQISTERFKLSKDARASEQKILS